MKILYHHRTMEDGAEGIHVREIIQSLRNQGHEVTKMALAKLSFKKSHINKKTDLKRNDRAIKIKSFVPRLLSRTIELFYNVISYFRVKKYLKQHSIDFVYERYALFHFGGLLAAKHNKIPVILEVNTPYAYAWNRYDKLYYKTLSRKIEKWVFENADQIIVVSEALKDYLIKMGIESNKIKSMQNGINCEKFNRDYTSAATGIRQDLGLENKTIVGFIGSLRRWHGVDLLIEIIPQLAQNYHDVHFLIVGSGELENDFKNQMAIHGCESFVTFTGRIPHEEIPKYIQVMDIPLMPNSNFYGSPMKIFEYMAMEKPVIAPRLKPIQEVIKENENGILVEPGNASSLKDGIIELLKSKEKQQSYGTNNRRKVFNEYTWDINAEKIIHLYESFQRKKSF